MFVIRENKGKKKGDWSPNYIVESIGEEHNGNGKHKW